MTKIPDQPPHVVVIGAGMTGLSAAYELATAGLAVTVLEKDDQIGGLAASVRMDGYAIERFYHHWFNSDRHVIGLADELRCRDHLVSNLTTTGMYLNGEFHKLSGPRDLLRFTPLSMPNRLRLGLLMLRARGVKDWRELESITAEQWLLKLCGEKVYKVVWEPLLRGKFGPFASEISAVWFWNKLLLRGGSRSKAGKEQLLYYRGGFGAFLEVIAEAITAGGGGIHTGASAQALNGGVIRTGTPAEALDVVDGRIRAVQTADGAVAADAVIATCAPPIIADLAGASLPAPYLTKLRRVKYLANVCVLLELSESLSNIYWLNVNDPEFPFVGIIEHTNFQRPQTCAGRHVVYLSKYLNAEAELYQMTDQQVLDFAVPHIKRLFGSFDESSVQRCIVHRARYAQPVIECNYSQLIPERQTPVKGLYIETMAQIYPQDRGTNYAIAQGRDVARQVAAYLSADAD